MQANSVNRLRIDWASFQSQVLAKAPNASTIPETFPAITLALGLLEDHHSFYLTPNNAGVIGNPSFPTGCGIPAAEDPAVPADVGYVRVPFAARLPWTRLKPRPVLGEGIEPAPGTTMPPWSSRRRRFTSGRSPTRRPAP